ncbi:serine carboxypeptidase-domain-containing protein [Armillaria luteobubalina]|uniref:carboxypeptidase C n=1 Tax=Armillaria luteobubalina TaxID=153913 RepID=A0AA39PTC0_9AGAR|nr:serine carboxypeptidase-domain-containing protein [Armillaria luteobubalina]
MFTNTMIMIWTALTLIFSLLLQFCTATAPPPLLIIENPITLNSQATLTTCTNNDPTSLACLSSTYFTTLQHPLYPYHSVRIKKTTFCDTTVQAYTGYIDISQTCHLFFYFFESRSDPDRDDVVFWTNGGPGCSSLVGLFMELGPCHVDVLGNGAETKLE